MEICERFFYTKRKYLITMNMDEADISQQKVQ